MAKEEVVAVAAFQSIADSVAGDVVVARSTDRILNHDVVGNGNVLCEATDARKVVVRSVSGFQVNCQVDGLGVREARRVERVVTARVPDRNDGMVVFREVEGAAAGIRVEIRRSCHPCALSRPRRTWPGSRRCHAGAELRRCMASYH